MSDFSSERAKIKKVQKELNSLEKALKNYKKTGIPSGLKGSLGAAVNNKTDEIVSKFSSQIADGRELMQQILDTIAEIEEREREEKKRKEKERKTQEKEKKTKTEKVNTGVVGAADKVKNAADAAMTISKVMSSAAAKASGTAKK